ncbi:MAG: glycoside hydrolase 5 family protein [Armatimonadota bacterium]
MNKATTFILCTILLVVIFSIGAVRIAEADSSLQKKDNQAMKTNTLEKKFREIIPGKIGKPLPIRRMHVDKGVLLYEDGKEVALWGVNYLPMSWYQFTSMKSLNTDMKKAIDTDIAHLKSMKTDIIRVHIFDREISDGKGNLVSNENLDLLEYLIASCKKNNIYVFITLLSWWSSPVQNPGNFSSNYTKMAMLYDEGAIKAETNYLKQILNKKNKYSGITMKDDVNICIFELFNEPWYWEYRDFISELPTDYRMDQANPEIYQRDKEAARDMWNKWCSDNKCEPSQESFDAFRHQYLKRYIDRMVTLMRDEGVKQPVGWSPFLLMGNSDEGVDLKDAPKDICRAIADSKADFFTISDYLGGFGYRDDRNNMNWTKDFKITGVLTNKAAVMYEFDATGTYTSAYLYPGMARKFRNFGAQIACQFQYDTIATAAYNTDWVTHYLNWQYTPEKTVSFMIAGEVFRNLPRGSSFKFDPQKMDFDKFAVSYPDNISIMSGYGKLYHSSALKQYMPLDLPAKVDEITAVGRSPYVEYDGTGIYTLKKNAGGYKLLINPDAKQIYNCMNPMTASLERKTVDLEYNKHRMKLNLPGWKKISVYRVENGKRTKVDVTDSAFDALPGEYVIKKID